ncbi:MAG: thioredoxin domain-containing protein [Candidatus Eiseniibacteriota bacterium]
MTRAEGENRLASEKSPYLLQHASNPVHWYPWGDEAFEIARREDKPVFLSIGYSTCHWCHVMERESFEQEDVARILNEHFVSVKVDREERPDVDQIYMTVCQAVTGSGGWPLTLLLTPDRRPFFVGTYFPAERRFGRPGLKEILYQIVGAWEQQRDQVLDAADKIVEAVQPQFGGSPGDSLGVETLQLAYEQLLARYDATEGGFGTAPKFPTPHVLTFLLRWWRRSGEPRALEMVEGTLESMRRGGIYDHVGLGFHRYSTDREWLVPHFEKMLYDQALLLIAYSEAFQATGNPLYGGVAQEIAAYVLRDLTSSEGAFTSAEDADSEGEEGKFYVWTRAEIDGVLGAKDGALYARAYGIEAEGNWRDEASGKVPGTNIPHLRDDPHDLARELGLTPKALAQTLEAARARLLEARGRRVRPHKDDKILTAWNGLMIAAMAKAARALGRPEFARAAERALAFIEAKLVRADGRLLARYRDGEAAFPAYLDDYAFLAWGLLELYEATFHARHLDAALKLVREMDRLFADSKEGGYFFTATDGEPLLARPKDAYDGAMPSGNSVAAMVLLRLGRITGDPELEKGAERLLRAFSGLVARVPSVHTQLLGALDFALGPTREIVIASGPDDPEAAAMASAVSARFLPRDVTLWNRPPESKLLETVAPFVTSQAAIRGAAAAYVCENYACKAPVTTAAALAVLLDAPIPRASS